ncbi:MAG: T9SS type A sorting domain-containing protein [Ignavibacteria bacterium]
MKTLQRFKIVSLLLIVMLTLSAVSFAQTPQFYNYNNGTVDNSFPFNQPAGKMIQTLVAPGEFNQPTPIANGNLTKFYVRMSATYPLGPATYSTFKVLFAQTALTTLPASLFTGPWDTVYQRASVTFTAGTSSWLMITLDHPFAYNSTQSLVIQIEQCSATGTTTGFSLAHTATAVMRRTFSSAGCPFTYGGQSAYVTNCGVDVGTVTPPCSNFSSEWTTGLAVLPDGATNASRVIPSGIIINDTGYVYIMGGGTPTNINRCYNTVTNVWSTKTVLPTALATTNGTTIKDSIYVIGGYTAAGTSGAVYKYNPRTDAWATKTPMPVTTMTADMVIVPWRDSLIICVGGGTGLFAAASQTNAVRYYNVYTDTWTTLAGTYPVSMAMMAGTIVGDTIFTFGGYDAAGTTVGTSYRGIITPGNPISITWSTIAPLPATFNANGTTYRSSAATIKSVNGGVLIVGGANAVGAYNGTAYLYNPCLNTYTTLTSATGSAKSNMGSRLYTFRDSIVYLGAGYNAAGQTSILKFAARCYNCVVTSTSNNGNTIPQTYSLSQNYPNPFNPVTKINYALPKSGLVTLKIYDVLGREVVNLVNENKAAGSYSVDFNASNLTSGVYFYRIEVNGYIDTKKMTLIK